MFLFPFSVHIPACCFTEITRLKALSYEIRTKNLTSWWQAGPPSDVPLLLYYPCADGGRGNSLIDSHATFRNPPNRMWPYSAACQLPRIASPNTRDGDPRCVLINLRENQRFICDFDEYLSTWGCVNVKWARWIHTWGPMWIINRPKRWRNVVNWTPWSTAKVGDEKRRGSTNFLGMIQILQRLKNLPYRQKQSWESEYTVLFTRSCYVTD